MGWRIRGRSVPLPAALRLQLEQFFGEGVDRVRVVEHSRFCRLHGRALAVTRRDRIYLRGSAEAFFGDPELVLHEYFHCLRQWSAGRLTVGRYVLAWLRHGYWNNPFEIEARHFASRHRGRLIGIDSTAPSRDA